MKEETAIERYNTKSIPELRKLAQKLFNAAIRKRDAGKPCISCGKHRELQAGHYLSAGKHPALALNEYNANGQCLPCNYFDHSNAIHYREGLIKRIGEDKVIELENTAAYYKRNGYKHSREVLIAAILKYR